MNMNKTVKYIIDYGKRYIANKDILTVEGFIVSLITLSYHKDIPGEVLQEIWRGIAWLKNQGCSINSLCGYMNEKLRRNDLTVNIEIYCATDYEQNTEITEGQAEEKIELKEPESYNKPPSLQAVIEELYKDSVAMKEYLTVRNGEENSAESSFENEKYKTQDDLVSLISDIKRVREMLSYKVIGQDNAIDTFVNGYFNAKVLREPKEVAAPKLTYLFAGPSGVGKTYLASCVAEELNLPFKRFDMSEYADDASALLEFCGSDKVYKNPKAGNVTDYVSKNPNAVLLFDEIEKASLRLIHLFLQILDAGYVRDNYTDEEVSFRNNIIIFTTNAGKQLYEDSETRNFSDVPRKVILDAIAKDKSSEGTPFFPEAICSRFAAGNVVMFNHIAPDSLYEIVKNQIENKAKRFSDIYNIDIQIDNRVYYSLILAEGGDADARVMKSRAEQFFNGEIFQYLSMVLANNGELQVQKIRIELEEPLTEEIKGLFCQEEPPQILVVAGQEEQNRLNGDMAPYNVLAAGDIKEAEKILEEHAIGLVAIDFHYGMKKECRYLSIDDIDSVGSEVFWYVRQKFAHIPVVILENAMDELHSEEEILLKKIGVTEVIEHDKENQQRINKLYHICRNTYMNKGMEFLTRRNKVLRYKVSQEIDTNSKEGRILLYDIGLETAVEAEDVKDILSSISIPDVAFDDVIGADDVKQKMDYFISYMKKPEAYKNIGMKTPKGILLYGPPGTGKTMIAKAMAHEAGVTFLATEGNCYNTPYGNGADKIHRLFRIARKYAPAILFIDEVEVIAKNRSFGGVDTNVLTAIFTEMDGFQEHNDKPVFVLAATNYGIDEKNPLSLDPAFVRRFDRKIYVDLPGKEERLEFLKRKLSKNNKFEVEEDILENIAIRSAGMSFAQMDGMIELALRNSIVEGKNRITGTELQESYDVYNFGESRNVNEEELRRTAIHETGHAFISMENGQVPAYVTIISRANYGGYTQLKIDEEKGVFTKEMILSHIRILLAGRAAEIVYYGEETGISTGASNDLQRASDLAMNMVCKYGMYDEIGPRTIKDGESNQMVTEAVNEILRAEMKKGIVLIREKREVFDKIVEALVEKNHLTEKELKEAI